LLGRNSFLVLDLRLDILDGVIGLDVQSDGLAGQRFHEDLHGTTTKTKDEMKRRFFLNVVVRKCSAVFELLASKDQSLLLRGNSFLILNLRLDVLDGIIRLDVQSDRLSCEGLDKDLHRTTAKTKDEVER